MDAQCAHLSLICSGERSLSQELPHFGIGTPKPCQNFRLRARKASFSLPLGQGLHHSSPTLPPLKIMFLSTLPSPRFAINIIGYSFQVPLRSRDSPPPSPSPALQLLQEECEGRVKEASLNSLLLWCSEHPLSSSRWERIYLH